MKTTNNNLTVEQHIQSPEYQDRLVRDIELTNRIKAGYTPAEPCDEKPRPRIIDGTIDEDAQEALGDLFMHYERLVAKEAHERAGRVHNKTSLSLDDFKNQGYFGIYHAAITYNPELGMSYTSHARRTVKSHLDYFAKQHESLIRLPSDVRDDISRYGRTIWLTYQAQERIPTRRQIARISGQTPEEIDRIAIAEAFTTQMGSIDEGYYTDGRDRKSTLEAGEGKWRSITPEATATRAVDIEATTTVLSEAIREVLAEREDMGDISRLGTLVIRLRFAGTNENGWYPMHLDEVAQTIKNITGEVYTRERIRQIESKTLAILRQPAIAERIRPFFDAA